jgi:predicted Zn-dependent protease
VFPLPGGDILISRNILAIARNEGEVAGLIAHAMAHVVLRHGTERASLAYLERAGIGALGGWVGEARTASRMINSAGGFGLGAPFLSFGPTDEYEADALATEIMAKAGYDPVAMAAVFSRLRHGKSRDSQLAAFFTRHPAPPDRESRIRNLANVVGHGRAEVVGGFSASRLTSSALPARSVDSVNVSTGLVDVDLAPVLLKVAAPSSNFVKFTHPDSILSIEYPGNWDVFPAGLAVSFAPAGGVDDRPSREPR